MLSVSNLESTLQHIKWWLFPCARQICSCLHHCWGWWKSRRFSWKVSQVELHDCYNLPAPYIKFIVYLSNRKLKSWSLKTFCRVCRFRYPQPDYSAFREASYGHSTLEIKNRTHAFYHWNRNDDGKKVATDSFILHNQYWWVQLTIFSLLLRAKVVLAFQTEDSIVSRC